MPVPVLLLPIDQPLQYGLRFTAAQVLAHLPDLEVRAAATALIGEASWTLDPVEAQKARMVDIYHPDLSRQAVYFRQPTMTPRGLAAIAHFSGPQASYLAAMRYGVDYIWQGRLLWDNSQEDPDLTAIVGFEAVPPPFTNTRGRHHVSFHPA